MRRKATHANVDRIYDKKGDLKTILIMNIHEIEMNMGVDIFEVGIAVDQRCRLMY